MKDFLSSRRLFILSFAIIILTNIVVLSFVLSNRYGEPDAHITLTERELSLRHKTYKENSGLSLSINWRSLPKEKSDDDYYYDRWRTPSWLNQKKLRELGFNIDYYLNLAKSDYHYKRVLPKEIYIVLEYNGVLYKESFRRTKIISRKREDLSKYEADEILNRVVNRSRLFTIDAGLDHHKLRKKYQDRSRFIISKGLVRMNYWRDNSKGEKIHGNIAGLSIDSIHVPFKYRKEFDEIIKRDKNSKREVNPPPRYEIELAFGNRLEPWILSVKHLELKK